MAAAGIAFVMLADTTAMSRSLAARRGEHVDANREIRALGAANVAAGIFQGFPVSTSTSRTIVAEGSGACTQVTGVVGALAIGAILARAERSRPVPPFVDPCRDHHRRLVHAVRLRESPLAVEGATVGTVGLTRGAARRRRPRCPRGHPRRHRALARATSYGARGGRTTRSSVGSTAPRATTMSTVTLRPGRSRASCCTASTRRSSLPTPSSSRTPGAGSP